MTEDTIERIHEGLWEAHRQLTDSYYGAIEAKLRDR